MMEPAELKRAENASRESEERFRAMFEHAAVAMTSVGLDGRWLRINHDLCDIVGSGHDEMTGLTFQDSRCPEMPLEGPDDVA